MSSNFTKIRKLFGWALIVVSVILSIVGIVIAAKGEYLQGGAVYVASQVTWYPGLALLGPEIVQKSKDIWNNLKKKVKGFFK
tara:strand:+ start:339 stop:584 length:246 start_codon:yes stop_codon:yes gene_type:complete